jgi:DNA polymerase III subunit epsilon
MLEKSFAIIDLETTGTDAQHDRITEIAILRVQAGEVVERWESLINPECQIPAEIQALTGISNAMVRNAPRFAQVLDEVMRLLSGAVFVAHNARFDYGFIKHALLREATPFTADVLCTVRLSRRLAPEHPSHSLDALVERYALQAHNRHRAMGDTNLVWELLGKLDQTFGRAALEQAMRVLLKIPSLPSQLPAEALDGIPDCPGVYLFYGVNDLPLYIGKSINLRDRIRSHFSSDYRNANDARLSTEIRRIEFQETAGEFGALLTETLLIRDRMPLLNKAKRKTQAPAVLTLPDATSVPKIRLVSELAVHELSGHIGPFSTTLAAKKALQSLASQHRLCWSTLGLEKRVGACFARQVRNCDGCCVGEESLEAHHARLCAAMEPLRIPAWPFAGPAALHEETPPTVARASPRKDSYVFDQWCLIGHDEPATSANFDVGIYKLLLKHAHALEPLGIRDKKVISQ